METVVCSAEDFLVLLLMSATLFSGVFLQLGFETLSADEVVGDFEEGREAIVLVVVARAPIHLTPHSTSFG